MVLFSCEWDVDMVDDWQDHSAFLSGNGKLTRIDDMLDHGAF